MNRLLRALAHLFPSVPPRDQAIVLTAMEGRPTTPVPASLGEDGTGTGPTTTPTSLGAGGTPEGEEDPAATEPAPATCAEATAPRPPVTTPPPVELLRWSAHPHHSWEFTDTALAQLVTAWQKETSA